VKSATTAPKIVPVAPPLATSPAMGLGGNAPPFRLPGVHFGAAVVFWLLGVAGLIWVAPDVVRGGFPVPRVVAVAHLFTLGWITTTILGALYQFMPVALGVPIRSQKLAYVSFAFYTPGLALFVGGMWVGVAAVFVPGAALFGTGLLIFAGNLTATLRRAREWSLTWWALAAATVFLVSTVVLGVSMAGNLRWGYLGDHRFLALGVHMHVALVGWVLLVMVGVAHRLLPMFLLSHGASEWPGRAAVILLALGAGMLLTLHHVLTPLIIWSITVLMMSGVIAFLAQAALFFRHRKKPTLDPGLRLAAIALGFLLLSLVLAPMFVVRGLSAPQLATAYGVAIIVGAISMFVAGHYYKILPFLVWFHRFGPLIGKQTVPRVADLYLAWPGNVAAGLLAVGALGLVVSTLLGFVDAARPMAAMYAAGAAIVAGQMLSISRRRP
jgi:hypothetical protein